MNSFRNIALVSTIIAGGLFSSLAPAAEFNLDCAVPMTNPISALVWNEDSETWVARVVDLGRVDIVQTAFKVPAPTPVQINTGYDANRAFDESIIGAGTVGAAKTLAQDSGS